MFDHQQAEVILRHDRQTWRCHWYDPDGDCEDWGNLPIVEWQPTALHAAQDFVSRKYQDFIRVGESSFPPGWAIVCVHNQADEKTLVGVKWRIGKGLEGASYLLDSQGKAIQRNGQIGLWKDAHQWNLTCLKWHRRFSEAEVSDLHSRERGRAECQISCEGPRELPVNPDLKRVLLIDSHLPDVDLFESEAATRIETMEWALVSDGREALETLQDSFSCDGAWIPDLVVLDLELSHSRFSGLWVLESMKSESGLDGIPTIIWTASDSPKLMHRAYELGITGYFVKHWDPYVRRQQVQAMLDFVQWDSMQRRVWSRRRVQTL